MSAEEQANVAKLKAEALAIIYDRAALTEDEMREKLDGDMVFGQLGPLPDDLKGRAETLFMPPTPPEEGNKSSDDK